MTKDLRVAVVGLGFGANHARILGGMQGVCLVAVADTDPARLTPFQATSVHTHLDHRSMLASEQVDAVVVAVPAGQHTTVALEVIAAGYALMIEKPIAPSFDEALRIVEAAQAASVPLMPGLIERFNPAVLELERRIHEGNIGGVLHVAARRMSATRAGAHGNRLPPRDVNVVHDSAIHDIDVVRFLMGNEVETVLAVSQSGIVTSTEDSVSALLRFHAPADSGTAHGPGSTASLEVNWLSPRRVRDLTVLGERGMYLVDYASQSLSLYEPGGEEPVSIPITPHDQLEAELAAFVGGLRQGTPMPVSASDGLAAASIAEAITQSARSGKPVSPKELPS